MRTLNLTPQNCTQILCRLQSGSHRPLLDLEPERVGAAAEVAGPARAGAGSAAPPSKFTSCKPHKASDSAPFCNTA